MSLRGFKNHAVVAGLLATGFFLGCAGAIGTTPGSPDNTGGAPGDPPKNDPRSTVENPPPAGTDPGRVTIHRLNRVEYNNTVRDLLGTTLQPANDFLPDNTASGFNNLADALALQTQNLQMYQDAAEKLVDDALGPQRAKNLVCDPATMGDACVRSTLQALARRAWRRPVTPAEVDDLMTEAAVAKAQGDTAEQGLKLAMQLVLMSPHFIFRVELDPDPTSTTPHPLSDHELASRLSYFIWSSMPDDGLFAAADAGNLHTPQVLGAQAARMIASPKASALVDNFGGQWLLANGIVAATPDAMLFPTFDAPLRAAMQQEVLLLFKDVATGAASADQLLKADYTYLNDRLASHYGLPAVGSTEMKKVPVTGTPRGGILSQGSFLTLTSHHDSTSPVNRGKAILNQLLCVPIASPPPGVKTDLPVVNGATLRQRLEQHRTDPSCSICHSLMDPLGFGLENFDAVGAYRTQDNGGAVDATGEYPDEKKTRFNGARELSALVGADPRLSSCFTSHLYMYALGRESLTTAGSMDPLTMFTLNKQFAAGGLKFSTLVSNLVTSDAFLKRRGEPVVAGGSK